LGSRRVHGVGGARTPQAQKEVLLLVVVGSD